jgi:ABC-type nickel/cobalt efflux system permease component RcnA
MPYFELADTIRSASPLLIGGIAIFSGWQTWRTRRIEKLAAETKMVSDATHTLVNSQRTELINANLALLKTITELRDKLDAVSSVVVPKSQAEIEGQASVQEELPPVHLT